MANFTRYIHTSFCDDVRYEQGDKLSLMGIYPNSLIVPGAAQGMIQKLCVIIEAHTPINEPFTRLTLQMRKDDKVIQEFTLPEHDLAQLERPAEGQFDFKMSMIGSIFVLQSMPIEKSCILSVVAITEREELLGGRLHVRLSEEGIKNQITAI
jgi:hypothetical protein